MAPPHLHRHLPTFRSLYTLSLPTTAAVDGGQAVKLFSFDPISSKWITVESPPLPPYLHHMCLRHPSFMSRNFSIQSVSVSGNLVLIAATAVHRSLPVPAFPHPLIFNPLSNTWSSCPPLSVPRRWLLLAELVLTTQRRWLAPLRNGWSEKVNLLMKRFNL
ncbi:putative kelch-type beta propeller [Helianthus annuus]|nr:putative kelch-type beta propeller [Helianthus annuus]